MRVATENHSGRLNAQACSSAGGRGGICGSGQTRITTQSLMTPVHLHFSELYLWLQSVYLQPVCTLYLGILTVCTDCNRVTQMLTVSCNVTCSASFVLLDIKTLVK